MHNLFDDFDLDVQKVSIAPMCGVAPGVTPPPHGVVFPQPVLLMGIMLLK